MKLGKSDEIPAGYVGIMHTNGKHILLHLPIGDVPSLLVVLEAATQGDIQGVVFNPSQYARASKAASEIPGYDMNMAKKSDVVLTP
jgi:hypothetical protein